MPSVRSKSPSRTPHQRGIVLIVALIVLVVMALVGLGMMRQTSSGVSIAGNVAFRQNGLSAGDYGTNAALFWLQNPGDPTLLNADQIANGYFATWGSNTSGDPTTLDWTQAATAITAANDPTQNTVLYIIHRLCAVAGPSNAIGQQCSVNDQSAANGSKGGYLANYDSAGNTNVPPPLYRISAKVTGPKNTISYTQVIVE